jgi:hypothetical protein
MRSFLNVHGSEIKGVLSGFERVRFRGTLRWLANLQGMGSFLWESNVLLKDFVAWSKSLTEQVRVASHRLAEAAGRPLQYLASSLQRKEDLAREIAAADGVTDGLICVLTCVEPCLTYQVGPNAETKRLELRSLQGKCLDHDFSVQHPRWGLMGTQSIIETSGIIGH